MAGVKHLVMSNWDVPDTETSEFMISFYTEFLQGNQLDDSFNNARALLRKKYPGQAYKWAAWVLLQ